MIGTYCYMAKQPQIKCLKASIAHSPVSREFGQDSMSKAFLSSVWATQLELRIQDGAPLWSGALMLALGCSLVSSPCGLFLFSWSPFSRISLCSRTACLLYTMTGTHLCECGSCGHFRPRRSLPPRFIRVPRHSTWPVQIKG